MGWKPDEVRSASLSDFSIMRDAWKRFNTPPEPGMSRNEAKELREWWEANRG